MVIIPLNKNQCLVLTSHGNSLSKIVERKMAFCVEVDEKLGHIDSMTSVF